METTRFIRTRNVVKKTDYNPIVKAYEKYRAAGFSCVPTSTIKSPAVPKGTKLNGNWDGITEYQKAHGIGIWCGNDVECLDFDNHFGDAVDIVDRFVDLTTGVFDKYDFVLQKTVSGGYHFIYKCSRPLFSYTPFFILLGGCH